MNIEDGNVERARARGRAREREREGERGGGKEEERGGEKTRLRRRRCDGPLVFDQWLCDRRKIWEAATCSTGHPKN